MKEIIKTQLNVKSVFFDKVEQLDVLAVKLDTKLTSELEAEGYAREVSRQVQAFRKKLGLQKKDEIRLILVVDETLKSMLEKHKRFIEERTNTKKLEFSTTIKEKFKNKTGFKIKDKRGEIVVINH
jgi:hypothetical protein